MKYAIIDVETTGGVAAVERITEIAIVLHDGEQVIETFSTLLNPERSIPWNITMITGITDEMVAHAPKFYEIARRVVELTEGAVFVAHNVSFDFSFVREEFRRLGYPFSRKQLCTVQLSRQAFPGLKSYSLSNLKKHFGIEAARSHRALDDTLATVQIFEMILAKQSGEGSVKTLIHHGIKSSKLPAGITVERLHELPDACGVYYLHDSAGEVIYVGKSLNIQKRIFEHFADQTPKGEKMREGVADFSWEITGSELVALLLESAEIKRLLPRINRAQRIRNFTGGIFTYFDQNGYRCLAAGKITAANRKKLQLIADYPKFDSAKTHLQSIARQHELCLKMCNLDFSERGCFQFYIKKCRGACVGEESAAAYNLRLDEALVQLEKRLDGNFFLFDKGRTDEEQAVVAVVDGRFLGFGFVDSTSDIFSVEDLLESVSLPHPDPEAGRIIRGFLEGKRRLRVQKF